MDRTPQALPVSVSLRSLFPEASFLNAADLNVSDATDRAAECHSRSLFAVIRGSRHDGADFIPEALAREAAGLLVEQPFPDVSVPQCVVPNVRAAYARLCAVLAGRPSTRLKVIGVTGTNGKSTTTWMLRSVFQAANRRCGLLGTIEYHDGYRGEPSTLTTPDPRTLSRWLMRMVSRQAEFAAIELSSHALHQDRAAGVELAATIVTNVTHDHLDYHGDYEGYWLSKRRIIDLAGSTGTAVINLDDEGSARMSAWVPTNLRLLTIGVDRPADLCVRDLDMSLSGARFELLSPWGMRTCVLPTPGRHNVSNAIGAAAAALSVGISLDDVIAGLSHFCGVPGRLEPIHAGQPYSVFVDYAHTHDALRHCLRTLRPLTDGRLICVFGAGGDRDRQKRPLLGAAALEADLAVVTSDNPRSEDPRRIIDEIIAGMLNAPHAPVIEPDRESAIRLALDAAGPGDCVLIAGKGHEREQVVGANRLPFDDRAVARRLLQERSVQTLSPPLKISA